MDKSYMNGIHATTSYEDAKTWIKYSSRSRKLANWGIATFIATASIAIIGNAKNNSLEKNAPIEVLVYKQVDTRLDDAITTLYNTEHSISNATKEIASEYITKLESEKTRLFNSEVCQNYFSKSRKLNGNAMNGSYGCLILTGILAGLSNFYSRKKEALEIKG